MLSCLCFDRNKSIKSVKTSAQPEVVYCRAGLVTDGSVSYWKKVKYSVEVSDLFNLQ